MIILLSGCTMGAEKSEVYAREAIYEEPILLSMDSTLNFDMIIEETHLEFAPMAMKLAEPDTIIMKQDTPKFDQSKLKPVAVKDTSKILKKDDDELSNKELRFKKDVQNQYKQEEISKSLDMLEEQQIKLDSLIKAKKKKDLEY